MSDEMNRTRRPVADPMMDRPAYELVRLIEAALDDADQVTDTPQRPNNIAVWGIRMLLEPYGGKPHRWQWPKCFECDHQMPLHNYGPCDLCGCAITPEEIAEGARDEALDESIEAALRDDSGGGRGMSECVCCGRLVNPRDVRVDRGLIHFDCYAEHHCGPDTPWPPEHVCADATAGSPR